MGQMLLIVGAMTLLGTLTLSFNNAVLDHMQRTYEAQAIISATTFAQAMMHLNGEVSPISHTSVRRSHPGSYLRGDPV